MKKIIGLYVLLLIAYGSTFGHIQNIQTKIIDVEWLSTHLNDPDIVIIHIAPLKLEYDREHIPGARYLYPGWLNISTPEEATTLAPIKDIKKTLESIGISNNSKIVLTFMNGLLSSTCRVYFTLDYLGLGDQTYILSGGVEQWKEAGKPVVKNIPKFIKGKLTIAENKNLIYNTDWIQKNLGNSSITIIDARSAPFFEGKSGGPRYGHIPGAINLPIAKLYEEKTIKFLPEEKLKDEFQKAGIDQTNELVTYCFVGNAASVVYFIARELGYKVHLYDGSMDEWGNIFDLPLEKDEVAKETTPENIIPFEPSKWNLEAAKVVDYKGRKSLMGIASLKDTDFTNGIIEFDIAVNEERSYPGLTFRAKNQGEYERIYIRPHLTKVFQNVVQYEGTFNGLDSWQLYYGPGKSASATFPVNEWFHVKVEVKDTQAKFYIVDMENPVLFIRDLTHGLSKGTLGLWGPMDGSAYFSNFTYRSDDNLKFPPLPKEDNPYGIIADWEISKPMKATDIDIETIPSIETMKGFGWQKVQSLPSGLVDISRYYGRQGNSTDVIWAKTELNSDKEQIMQFSFGYSDYISIFLNGKPLFIGNSSYQSRDGNFQGIVGYNDYIMLPLKKGKNELLVAVAEDFGGWGFMFKDVNAIYESPKISKKWEIKFKLKYPESVVYDKKRDVLYVSNLTLEQGGYISKVNLKGEIIKFDFIAGILQPTGLCISNDKLYIVGRYNLVEYDLEKNEISNRFPFPDPIFANDITKDDSGNLYISDSGKGAIYKFENGTITEWLKGEQLQGSNGILADNGKILVGTSGDGSIKSIDVATKANTTIFTFGMQTPMDGLVKDGKGNYLISDNNGRLFKIDQQGKEELLLNTKSRQINIADFEYIPEKNLLIIPTLFDNRLMMYEMK